MNKTPDLSNRVTSEEAQYGSGITIVSLSFTPDDVRTSVAAMFSNPLALLQTGGVSAESPVQAKRLSPAENTELLRRLEQRFQAPNTCRPAGVAFADVKKILETDPDLAYQVYAAETFLGAEMDYVEDIGGNNHFTDLSKEVNIPRQIIFLQSLPREEREVAIQSLRDQYPNIPADAFNRLPNDKRGPNKWEGLLIERVLRLESIPEADYRALQAKLSREQWLDKDGISWLEPSEEQLARGGAPDGGRYSGEAVVVEGCAGNRDVVRGVRVRAKGSVA